MGKNLRSEKGSHMIQSSDVKLLRTGEMLATSIALPRQP